MSSSSVNSPPLLRLEWKYLLTVLLPASCFLGLYFRSVCSPGSLYMAFIIVPILDRYFFGSSSFLPKPQPPSVLTRLLLYLNVPVLLGLTGYYYYVISELPVSGIEWFFLTLNLGIVYGSNGINVAHELGHRSSFFDRAMAFILLLPSYYVHFTDAHNLGHHVKVGRPDDPASASRNQSFYEFLPRVIIGEWADFISINRKRLERSGKRFWSIENKIIWYVLADILWALLIWTIWGTTGLVSSFVLAFLGISLLALINYIEHYGLVRTPKGGRYERVAEHHAWDSKHYFGRTMLFQLPLHADHHMNAGKEYPELIHREESPELPYGYPESMLRALIPAVWKNDIHPLLNKWEKQHLGHKS